MKETRSREERIEDFKTRLDTEIKQNVRNPQVRSARVLMLDLLTFFGEEEHHEPPPTPTPEPAWSAPPEPERPRKRSQP